MVKNVRVANEAQKKLKFYFLNTNRARNEKLHAEWRYDMQ